MKKPAKKTGKISMNGRMMTFFPRKKGGSLIPRESIVGLVLEERKFSDGQAHFLILGSNGKKKSISAKTRHELSSAFPTEKMVFFLLHTKYSCLLELFSGKSKEFDELVGKLTREMHSLSKAVCQNSLA